MGSGRLPMAARACWINSRRGFHARPAEFVKEAKKYDSDIKVVKGGKEANAKNSLSLMSLGDAEDDELTIRTEGGDEESAADALADLITQAKV